MLSKEDIEKVKDTPILPYNCLMNEERKAANILLQYIDQLEKSDASKEQSSMNYYNKYKELKQENKKLNKMIDEMAMEIASYDNDETFCKEVYPNNSCEGNGIPCWDCIKQYFEKKVEEN